MQTSAAIQAWASHIATVTGELKAHNDAVAGVIDQGGLVATNEQARNLIERLKPTLPVIVANLASIGQVAVTYQNDIEQLLVLLPHAVSEGQATFMANANTNQAYRGGEYLSFNLNINLPPACTTGFLPAQQQRIPQPGRLSGAATGRPVLPDPPGLSVQCPWGGAQHSVRDGAGQARADGQALRKRPELRAAQRRQQLEGRPERDAVGTSCPPRAPAGHTAADAAPPALVAVSEYDPPATGLYVGPDGRQYTQSELAQPTKEGNTWQSMLLPGQP